MKTPHTDQLLVELVHPISPRQMRNVVYQLVRDNDLNSARELAARMVVWAHHAPGEEDFYYWLGVEQMLRALADGAMDRWRKRSEQKFERTRRICEGYAALGKKAAS